MLKSANAEAIMDARLGSPFNAISRGSRSGERNQKVLGYKTRSGRLLALNRVIQATHIWFQPWSEGAVKPRWRNMDDAERAVAYSPSSMLDGPLDPYIQAYIDDSKAAYAALPHVTALRYGPEPANTIDVVVPESESPAPLHAFIHGGYWQELSKREAFFPAPETLEHGIAYATIDYTLAPRATIDEIVEECRLAIRCLRENAPSLNISPDRIVVSGSSAGAHLAAMCGATMPAEQRPAGLVLLSGVFDLEALVGTYINDAVGMDVEAARRNSPALLNLAGFPPSVVAWGENETDEFKRQSLYFADLARKAGGDAETLEAAGRNHFDIVDDLAGATGLGRMLVALVRRTGSSGG